MAQSFDIVGLSGFYPYAYTNMHNIAMYKANGGYLGADLIEELDMKVLEELRSNNDV